MAGVDHTSLLSGNYWHTGTGNITYSFLSTPIPSYYPTVDIDGDGVNDAYGILPASNVRDELVAINANVSLNTAQTNAALTAIARWNEVANFNLTAGSSISNPNHGSPITGGGTLVSGLGGPAGYGELVMPRNDDGYQLLNATDVAQVFENGLNFFGTSYTTFYVNTNGSISFGNGISTYTPSTITGGGTPAILPYWADVDTRSYASGGQPPPIYVDIDSTSDVITVTWPGVDYFDVTTTGHTPRANWFQLQLFDRGNGDFDIVFRYQSIQWTTGDASGGTNGLGGTPAHAGWTAGNGTNYYELPQSGNQSALLSLSGTPGNTGTNGLWVFEVRNGAINVGDITFGAYNAYSTDGTDGTTNATLPPNGQPQTELFGFVSAFPASGGTTNPDYRGDLWLNNNLTVGTSNQQQVLNPTMGNEGWVTFLHELGHALGFTHPNNDASLSSNQYTVMSYNPHPSQNSVAAENRVWPVTPMLYDIQAAQAAYGANMNTRTGDDVYFAAGGHFPIADGGSLIAAIWDAGGNDTFDASAQSNSVSIDLRPGYFSTIGAVANNITIAQAVSGTTARNAWIENAIGGAGNDTLTGNGLDNRLEGRDGNDKLYGRNGNDTLKGNAGDDTLRGHDGNDNLQGGGGDDIITGGNGNDLVNGGRGNDWIHGDTGDDRLYASFGDDIVFGDDGADVLKGYYGNDELNGGAGNDYIYGGYGTDTILGNDGDDRIWGNRDDDSVYGGSGNDRLYGNLGNDLVSGGPGDDILYGGGQADLLYGGSGRDYLYGENGDDTLDGGFGDDVIYGGGGKDYFTYAPNGARDEVRDFEDGLDLIDLTAWGFASAADALALATSASWGVKIDFRSLPAAGANDVLYIPGALLGVDFTAADIIV